MLNTNNLPGYDLRAIQRLARIDRKFCDKCKAVGVYTKSQAHEAHDRLDRMARACEAGITEAEMYEREAVA